MSFLRSGSSGRSHGTSPHRSQNLGRGAGGPVVDTFGVQIVLLTASVLLAATAFELGKAFQTATARRRSVEASSTRFGVEAEAFNFGTALGAHSLMLAARTLELEGSEGLGSGADRIDSTRSGAGHLCSP